MSTILITGANRGIGLGTAIELARRGQRVFAGSRNLANAAAVQEAAAEAGVSVEVVELDVSSSDSIARAIDTVVGAASLDVVVNNAAATGVAGVDLTPLELTDEAATAAMIDTNLHGPLRVIRAALPVMRAQGRGRIVNVSSQLAHPRLGGLAYGVYCATKAGLHALTLSLAREVEPLGIRVVLVEGGVLAATEGFDASIQRARDLIRSNSAYTPRFGPLIEGLSAMDPARLPTVEVPAAMIADACLDPDPDLRHPLAAQAHIDAANRIGDRDFQRLARGERAAAVLAGYSLPLHFWGP